MRDLNMEKDSIQILFELKSHTIFYNLTVSCTFYKVKEVSYGIFKEQLNILNPREIEFLSENLVDVATVLK